MAGGFDRDEVNAALDMARGPEPLEGIGALRLLRERHPGSPYVATCLALALWDVDIDECNATLDEATQLAWDDPDELTPIAEVVFRRGRTADAKALLRRVESVADDDFRLGQDVLFLVGEILADEGEFQDALPILREAAAEQPSGQHLGALASTCVQLGLYDEARQALANGLTIAPGNTYLLELQAWFEAEGMNE